MHGRIACLRNEQNARGGLVLSLCAGLLLSMGSCVLHGDCWLSLGFRGRLVDAVGGDGLGDVNFALKVIRNGNTLMETPQSPSLRTQQDGTFGLALSQVGPCPQTLPDELEIIVAREACTVVVTEELEGKSIVENSPLSSELPEPFPRVILVGDISVPPCTADDVARPVDE